MKKIMSISLLLLLLMNSPQIYAADSDGGKGRVSLGFNKEEKSAFLSEMRQMLASIQGIISGIGEEDRALIVRSARYSGNRMARETPDSIKQKTPKSFKEIGGPTHMMFEELVVRAEVDDMDTLASFTGELMKQCISCHEMFTVH